MIDEKLENILANQAGIGKNCRERMSIQIAISSIKALVDWKEEELKKYYELLMAVGNKYEGETRHQTALKYIINAEKGNNETGKNTQPN